MMNNQTGTTSELHAEATESNKTTGKKTTSAFGTKTIFGGGKVALWGTSIVAGIVIGVIFGVIAFIIRRPTQLNDWTFIILMAVLIGGCSVGFCWVTIVDRTTITGSIPHPEENVEDTWRTQAMSTGLIGMVLADTVLLLLVAFYDKPIPSVVAAFALLGIMLIGLLTMACAYFVYRKKAMA
ncbi:hypothetical protein OZX73_04740 [Bifidobacterium sp. ESL0775]|uniref:hypothetical protein n=1 Tax=Bifidobacterium sp. ESL0775 TaxID=2983230 RepID=UPI0023F8D0C8|nr:hypothetical protein [Bifidobacterium sp. ESL0775]WEV68605.1 hypothetical protein OZX73_04740 [Bifidobacterium sp. ESL0775]